MEDNFLNSRNVLTHLESRGEIQWTPIGNSGASGATIEPEAWKTGVQHVARNTGAHLLPRKDNYNTGEVEGYAGEVECIGGKATAFHDDVVQNVAIEACDWAVNQVLPPGGVAIAKGVMKVYKSATIDNAKTDGKAGFLKVGVELLTSDWKDFDQGLCTQAISVFQTSCQQEDSKSTKGGAYYLKEAGEKGRRLFKILVDPTKD